MANNIDVKAKAKTVDSEKTKKQSDDLAKAKKNKEELEKQAKKLSEEKKNTVKEKISEPKKEIDNSEVISNLTKIASSAVLTNKSKKGFIPGLIVGLVLGIALSFMFNIAFTNPLDKVKNDVDEIISDTFLGYTAADFKDAVLGEASQHQELIVMEQPLEIETTITKAGLGGLEIFSKTKQITYAGYGVYTVDLKDIDENHISVDEENKKVKIYINHAVLQYTNIDYDNMKFEDTEKGLLSFGDISLTMEQQNTLEKSVIDSMNDTLTKSSIMNQADEFAKMKTWEIFQPLVSAVSQEYIVEIEFN